MIFSQCPEPLEARIAPAVFFLHGNNLTITDSAGADVAGDANETTAATAAGALTVINLDADPQFEEIRILQTDIAGLTVRVVVAGNVLAGGSISNLSLLGVSPGAAGSAESIRTGNSANGGDITNVVLADGVRDRIQTGSSIVGDTTHHGGSGGSIVNVTSFADQSWVLVPGTGGNVSKVSSGMTGDFNMATTLISPANGGAVTGGATGAGGAGGAGGEVFFSTGAGGSATAGPAGKGGDFAGFQFEASRLNSRVYRVELYAGVGGAGGAISGNKIAAYIVDLTAGPGGSGTTSGAKAGNGGSITMNTLTVGSHAAGIIAGNTGTPGMDGAAASGGSISGLIGAPGGGYLPVLGLHAGLSNDSSKNGGITNIVATAISTIIAGTPPANVITTQSAVNVIAGLTVKRVGVDLNSDFIVTDGAGTWTGPGDAAILLDGIVLVKNTRADLAALSGKIIAANFHFAV